MVFAEKKVAGNLDILDSEESRLPTAKLQSFVSYKATNV